MLVYDIESRGAPAPLDQNNILTEQLKKLQIPGLSEEILQKIYAHPQAKLDFSRDIDAISSQIPANPSEISRMDFYIKGYGQVLDTPFGKLSFVEIQGHEKKDEILDDHMTPEQSKAYIAWEKGQTQAKINSKLEEKQVAIDEKLTERQVAIAEVNKGTQEAIAEVDKGTQETIDGKLEDLKKLNTELQSSTEQIRSLSSLPPDIEQKALEEAKRNPPAKLKDIPLEKYGEYKNLILAEYTIANRVDIASRLSDDDKKKFGEAIKNAGNVLGYDIGELSKITSTVFLGSNRDKVEGLGKELIKNGYSENVVWNSGDRTISFSNGRGEKRIIETASMPPRERMDRGNLSISREVTENSPDPARIRNDGKRADAKKLTKSIGDQTMEVLSAETSDKKKVLNPSIAGLMSNTLNFVTLDTPESAAFSKNMINVGINTIKMEQDDLTKLVEEKTRANPLDPDIGTIRGVITRLTALSDSMKSLVSKTNIEKEDDQKNPAIWENSARNNLDWMTDAYMDNIGPNAQATIDRIIGLVNKDRNKGNQISLGEPLSTTSKDILQRSIAKLGGTPEVLTSGDRLPSFQRKISEALRYSPSHRDSIESILKGPANPETPPTTTL